MKKQDFKSLTRNELINWFAEEGYPEFRGRQVFNWIYKNGVQDFDEMGNLPIKLKDSLREKSYVYNNLIMKDALYSADGTVKYLWSLSDCETIESVYIPFIEDGRYSVCISSQVGCAMDCKFCATAAGGLVRNLTPGEIVEQVLNIQRMISKSDFGKPRISNVVFMGMGEPLANLKSVLKSIEIINDDKGFDIGQRKITISTSGLVPKIRELADKEMQIVLAVSLNAPNNYLRDSLMPINKKYPLKELLAAVKYYINKTGRRVTFEYVLIDKVNDSKELAVELANLLKGLLCHVNIIPLNPIKEFNFNRPPKRSINEFRDILGGMGIETTIRQERGSNIEAACGQLRRLKSKG